VPIILQEIGTGGVTLSSAFDTASDVFQIVDRHPGGQVRPLFDLNTGVGYYRERDSFVFTPGAGTAQQSRSARRYGGSRTVGMTHDNGTIAWTAVVRGETQMELAQRVETLLSEIEEESYDRWIEWRPPGIAYSSFLGLAGPGSWQPRYQWREWAGSGFTKVEVSFPVRPLVEWDPMQVSDAFDVNFLDRYTFDSGNATMFTHGTGQFTPNANLTTERRVRWMDHGYQTLEGMAQITTEPTGAFNGYKMGVILRASAANTYIEVYQDDNGTNTRLRIDVVIAGTRTNRFTTNVTRFGGGGTPVHSVRAWIVGNTVFASNTTADATVATGSYTLVGGELTSLVAGYTGWTWTPQNAAAKLLSWMSSPYYWQASLPATVRLNDIPGSAPAKADLLMIRETASSSNWGLYSWAQAATASSTGSVPFGVVESSAATAGSSGNWSNALDAVFLNGSGQQDTSVTGADEYFLQWYLAPHNMKPDEFAGGQLTLEVWGRLRLSSTLVSPRAVISVRADPNATVAIRYSDEYGEAGRPLPVPNSTQFRIVRLGTITVPVERNATYAPVFRLQLFTAAGSSGTLALDHLVFAPARSRAAGPTGRALDTSYPSFISSNGYGKLVRSDLSGRVVNTAMTMYAQAPDHGLMGSQILLPPGDTDLFALASIAVPDDPLNVATSDTVPSPSALCAVVTPRSFMFRDTE
jgi:hypothetical protein